MIASMSESYHILSIPEAPAPTATITKDAKFPYKSIFPGAITMPTKHVKITRDITLGFISKKRDLM